VLFYAFKKDPETREAVTDFYKETFNNLQVIQTFIETIKRALDNHRQSPSTTTHEALSNLRTYSNLTDVEFFFTETKNETQAIAEACELETSTDFDIWCFKVEFSSVKDVRELVEACGDQEEFLRKLATTKTKNQQNILMIGVSNIESFKYLVSQLVELDHERQRALLTEKDNQGWNVLRYSIALNLINLHFVFETYEHILGKRRFEQVLEDAGDEFFSGLNYSELNHAFKWMITNLETKLMVTLSKNNINAQYSLCSYLYGQTMNQVSNNSAKRFLIPEYCHKLVRQRRQLGKMYKTNKDVDHS
jgi:hypothetical protein